MTCTECLDLLPRFLDDDLDPTTAAAVTAHLTTCASCRAEEQRALTLRRQLRENLVRYPAPDVLKARVRQLLIETPPGRTSATPRRSWLVAAGVLIAVASSAVTAVVVRSAPPNPAHEVLAAHLRALMPGHLTDVVSSDQHNVKPWFNGRVDLSPPVPDLSAEGFPLVGGRIDYVDERAVAVVIYSRRQHLISLSSWPAEGTPRAPHRSTSHGYHLIEWRDNGLEHYAVSDLNLEELDAFLQAWRAAR